MSNDVSTSNPDIFPNFITTPDHFHRLKPLVVSSITAKKDLFPFIYYMQKPRHRRETPDTKVYYAKVRYSAAVKAHFDLFDKRFDKDTSKTSWHYIEKRLLRSPKPKPQNLDCRLSFKYERHFFVVKKFFTTGLRKVQPGTIHFFEIGQNPLFLYVINQRTAKHYDITTLRSFNINQAHAFRRKELEPNKAYVLPANLSYVLCTYSPAYFSIFVMEDKIHFRFKVHWVDIPQDKIPERVPPSQRILRSSSKVSTSQTLQPPPTPLIEEVDLDSDSEDEDISDLITFPSREDTARMPPPPSPAPSTRSPPPPSAPFSSPSVVSPAPSTSTSIPPPASPSHSTASSMDTMKNQWLPILEREVKVVSPDHASWYQRWMAPQVRLHPKGKPLEVNLEQEPEGNNGLDLRTRIRTPEEPRIQERASQTETLEGNAPPEPQTEGNAPPEPQTEENADPPPMDRPEEIAFPPSMEPTIPTQGNADWTTPTLRQEETTTLTESGQHVIQAFQTVEEPFPGYLDFQGISTSFLSETNNTDHETMDFEYL